MEIKRRYLLLAFGLIFFFLWGVALSWGPEVEDQGQSASSSTPVTAGQASAAYSESSR